MAKRRQPLIAGWLIPGLLAASLLLLAAFLAFGALWYYAPQLQWRTLWADRYLWHVVRFTIWQAFLSALFSVVPAVFLARALYRRHFPGRTLLLRLCAMTLVLPVLVAVFGILNVYGRQGWFTQLMRFFGFDYQFSPYGLQGILLAHVFFNLPLATRLLLQALETIAPEQRQLAAQLGMNRWQFFRIVEWPGLQRQIWPAAALIFMLCFASFATVLVLGGGPRATTIELAIYQALSVDFDLGRAALLALVQIVCCLGFVLIGQHLGQTKSIGLSQQFYWRNPQDTYGAKLWDSFLISLLVLLLIPPLAGVVVSGINPSLFKVLQQLALWQALWTSIRIALGSGIVCILLTMMILWSSRELKLRHFLLSGQLLELSGMLILAMPGLVLATGFFLIFNSTIGLPRSPFFLVIVTNAMMAIPYALKILENPMYDLAERYNPLCLSLGLTGWQRLKNIELKALKQMLFQALAYASVLSMGDFGVIALFGNEDFRTLPLYLYQQIGAYRSADGAVTAFLLLLLCFLLFTFIEKLASTMLLLDNLTYMYQDAPMCFTFDVKAGERVAIIGPSGAGKSTLLSLIAGFIFAKSGRLILTEQTIL